MNLETLPRKGYTLINPPSMSQPQFQTISTAQQRPLIVLFDPTAFREETAHRLAKVGNWRVLALDTNQPTLVASVIQQIVSAAYGVETSSYKPAAFVLEAQHMLQPDILPELFSYYPAQSAWELLETLTRYHNFLGYPFVLYTADQAALARARREYAATRQDRYHRLHRFDGAIQRDHSAESDLAVAQLLEQLLLVHNKA